MLTPKEQSRFDAYLAGEMSASEAEALEDALAAHEDLLTAFEAYAADQDVVRQGVDYSPSPQFTARVRDRIRRRSGGRFFQEDVVTKRYIPIFVVVAFTVLIVVAIAARMQSTDGLTDEDAKVVEQGAVAEDVDEQTAGNSARGRRISDRSHRRNPSHEDYMKPASENRRYQDLPVSGGRTPANVTYTRRVWTLTSDKNKDALREEIAEVFGNVSIEEADGYLRLQIRDQDVSGARQRLEKLDGELSYDSTKVPADEAKERYLRFYYDTPDADD